jgi:hypothetical protein
MSLTAQSQPFSGGVIILPYNLGTVSTGSLVINSGFGPLQYLTNNGAFNFTPPSAGDGSCDILVTNGSTPGAITFGTGWKVSSNTGDAFDTVSGHQFILSVRRINGISTYLIKALQ